MQDVATVRAKFEVLRPYLDERRRRLWAAAEALALGRGGMTAVATPPGLQRATICVGIGGTHRPRRPDVAAALDLQEHPPTGGRAGAPGSSGQPHDGR